MKHIFVQALTPDQLAAVERILSASLQAADPRAAVQRALTLEDNQLTFANARLNLDQYRRARVVGVGKAAQSMTAGLVDVLGDRLADGLIITKHVDAASGLPERIRVLPGGHPVPSIESATSTRALVDFLAGGDADDLVFCMISGGGSALMTLPVEGVTLEDMQNLTRLLLACGADIREMNTLRKHLDQVKGGGLARRAAPARLVTLVLSDVIGSPLDGIASGPTVADSSTYADALAILRKYGIYDQAPASIRTVLESGARGDIPETVKPGDACLEHTISQVIASNPQAAAAGLAQARREGFHTLLLTTYLQGEAAQVGSMLAAVLREIDASGQPLPRPACIAAGGETTVTLRGSGKGGRNQEMALGAAFLLAGLPNAALVTLGTDGEDGPTDAAGAVATGETIERARALGRSPLEDLQNNDAYHFFEALDDLLMTGPTGTNVNDLAFLFAF